MYANEIYRALTNGSDAYEELIEVTVGPDKDDTKTFRVYRGLLCFHARYFSGLLNSGFTEAGSNSVRLVDVDIDVIQCCYYWINSGILPDSGTLVRYSLWETLTKTYAFADYYLAQHFRNALLNHTYCTMFTARKFYPTLSCQIYDTTLVNDLLRLTRCRV
jgi:hypothetical protein